MKVALLHTGGQQRSLGFSPDTVRHVILDRDGVLNEESASDDYLADPTRFHWLPGALETLAVLRNLGIRVSVATNQSGIGRGLMTETDLAAVHCKMVHEAQVAGGSIDAIFFCPHAPTAGCGCRKPAAGLLEAAIRQSAIPRSQTLMIGDALRDLDAAQAAGITAALVRTGKGHGYERQAIDRDVPVFDDLSALAAAMVLRRDRSAERLGYLRGVFADHAAVIAASALNVLPVLSECIDACHRSLEGGGKILACGNGGSAADAQHFVAELIGRYHHTRPALPAIALMGDPATFTALSNDFGFEQVFSRQIDALSRPGDVLIAISTSGHSPNVLTAARLARERGCTVVALTGRSGGELAKSAHLALRVPSDVVARIQEVHGLCLHSVAQALDSERSKADSK